MEKLGIGLFWLSLNLSISWKVLAQQILCPRLPKPWNGQIVGTCDRSPGSQCIFHCREPYLLFGSRVRECREDGTWSGVLTTCELEDCGNCGTPVFRCPSLYDPENGLAEGHCQSSIVGKSCMFHCYNGYDLMGQSTLTCREDGDWSSEPPICRRIESTTNPCPTLIAPEGGRLVGSCASTNPGDTCQLVCITGYRPTEFRILVCQPHGLWSDSLPKCINDGCPRIDVSQASVSGACSPGNVGETCTITCNSGYVLTGGSGVLTCQADGRWSGTVPTCTVQSCPPLNAPEYGMISGICSPGQDGKSCNFYCNPGFRMLGQASLVCSDGNWSGSPPRCTVQSCPALNAPEYGSISGTCSPGQDGKSCNFYCNPGFQMLGQASLVCKGGDWSGSPPRCIEKTCPPLTPSTNAFVSGSCSEATVGEICAFTCLSGYDLVGKPSLKCLESGNWSSAPPTCSASGPVTEESCPVLSPPTNGEFLECDNTVGGQCIVICNRGFYRSGSKIRTCLPGAVWSGYAPTCTRSVAYSTSYTYKVVPLWSIMFG